MMLLPNLVFSQQSQHAAYHLKGQFAGDIGFLSAGIGRSFFEERLETDIFFGYLPESIGGVQVVTTAIKASYVPFSPVKTAVMEWQALKTGWQLSYTFGKDYFAKEPRDRYPKSYYGFSTALHLYFFLGGQVDFGRVHKTKRFGFYYEAGATGEYIISYVSNPDYLSLNKIFNLALGIRYAL